MSYEANDWLMRRMTQEISRPRVTAVHSYEDCSLLPFAEAKRLGKACIYDLPIGYFAAWDRIRGALARKYSDWVQPGEPLEFSGREQKMREIELADLILAPSRFVADTVAEFHHRKTVTVAPYGIDVSDRGGGEARDRRGPLTFLFVGHCSLRKGTPLLLDAWRASALKDARLLLVGLWHLDEKMKRELPPNCIWTGPVSSDRLQEIYRDADVFVFPTNFEGRALVVLEALGAGLPVLTTMASGIDSLPASCGGIVPSEDKDALVTALRTFAANRNSLAEMSRHARNYAINCTWKNYRDTVSAAVAPFV